MLVWGIIAITALMAIVSLAVDLGRVQLAKTELRAVADAAARYAAKGIDDGTAVTKAQAVAAENRVDMQPLALLAGDVELGNWDASQSPRFSAARTPHNAVRVHARKLASRGTAVPTYFLRVLGVMNVDVSAAAVATAAASSSHGLIGLQWIDLNSATVDSYSSAAGAYGGANRGELGSLASNGSVSLNSSTVRKDVYMLSGQTLSTSSSSYGTRKTGAPISVPTPSAGIYATVNDNGRITPAGVVSGGNFDAQDKNITIPAGNYYFSDLHLKGGTLNVTGNATIYVNGNVHIHSSPVFNVGNQPGRLTIKVVKASGALVHLNSVDAAFADIQAPTADIHLNSTKAFYGRLVGKTIKLNSTDAVHFDSSLPPLAGATNTSPGGGAVALVD
jgi:hypothetical protein